jgi:hypothetical protein
VISWGVARTIAVTLASRTENTPDGVGFFDYPTAVERAFGPLAEFTDIHVPSGP